MAFITSKNISMLLIALAICFQIYPQISEKEGKIVKVLSFNILHSATAKGDFNLDVIAQVILDTDPDFVALQEVDFKTDRAKKYDLATELGWRTKMIPLFARAMPYDGGEYGEGILSKHTFLKTRNVPLPFTKGNEPKAALEIVTVLPAGDTVAFIGTHLDHIRDHRDRVSQTKEINRVFASNIYPTVLAGDLNAEPDSEPIRILEKIWTTSYDKENPRPTFPSNDPSKKIDYVMFYPKNRWKVLKTEVDRIGSLRLYGDLKIDGRMTQGRSYNRTVRSSFIKP